MKSIFAFLLLSFFLISSTVLEKDIQKQTYKVYMNDNTDDWKTFMEQVIKDYEQEQSNAALFEVLIAQYGFLGHCVGRKQNTLAKKHLPIALENGKKLLAANEHVAEVHALMSSLYGLEISISSSFKMMSLGKKSLNHIKTAIELDNNSPLVCIQYANSKFHTPKMFGGSIDEAVTYYEKGLALFEKQANHEQNWLYLEALAVAGQAYTALDKYDQAAKYLDKALAISPNFQWIKMELYPKLEAKR